MKYITFRPAMLAMPMVSSAMVAYGSGGHAYVVVLYGLHDYGVHVSRVLNSGDYCYGGYTYSVRKHGGYGFHWQLTKNLRASFRNSIKFF